MRSNNAIAIIPARGGSTRIPRKNIKEFHGKPIIAYSITTARTSDLFNEIYVSTDDEEIADIAVRWGASVHWRSEQGAKNETGTQEVMREALSDLEVLRHQEVCCIYATAPLMAIADLIKGHEWLQVPYTYYTFAVGRYPYLHDAGQFYWGRAWSFLYLEPLLGPHTRMIPIDPARDCDINTPSDWVRAENMYEELYHV